MRTTKEKGRQGEVGRGGGRQWNSLSISRSSHKYCNCVVIERSGCEPLCCDWLWVNAVSPFWMNWTWILVTKRKKRALWIWHRSHLVLAGCSMGRNNNNNKSHICFFILFQCKTPSALTCWSLLTHYIFFSSVTWTVLTSWDSCSCNGT